MNYFDSCSGVVHTINEGDTVYALSGRYRIPLALILRANPYVDVYNLQIGDKLCIPILPGQIPVSVISYIIKDGDTLMDILERFNIDLSELLRYNNLRDMKLIPGMTIEVPGEMNN